MEQQDLLDRQRKAMDIISKHPKTAAQVRLMLEYLVTTLEEISIDLATVPDEQVAENVRKAIAWFRIED